MTLWLEMRASLDNHQDFFLALEDSFLLVTLTPNRFSLKKKVNIFIVHMNLDICSGTFILNFGNGLQLAYLGRLFPFTLVPSLTRRHSEWEAL